jgi:alkylation response protein AidB-like acyl-CoA dehydrogenase
VEVGSALARKTAAAAQANAAEAEKLRLMSKMFANQVAQLVAQNVMTIVMGSGAFDHKTVAEFLETVNLDKLNESYTNIISDMDRVADILFER